MLRCIPELNENEVIFNLIIKNSCWHLIIYFSFSSSFWKWFLFSIILQQGMKFTPRGIDTSVIDEMFQILLVKYSFFYQMIKLKNIPAKFLIILKLSWLSGPRSKMTSHKEEMVEKCRKLNKSVIIWFVSCCKAFGYYWFCNKKLALFLRYPSARDESWGFIERQRNIKTKHFSNN